MKKAKISNIFCIQPVESHKKISVKLHYKSYIIKWFTVLQLFLRGNKYWLIFAKFVLKDYWLILSKFVLKDYRKNIQLKTGTSSYDIDTFYKKILFSIIKQSPFKESIVAIISLNVGDYLLMPKQQRISCI